jgi:hypothetical protein
MRCVLLAVLVSFADLVSATAQDSTSQTGTASTTGAQTVPKRVRTPTSLPTAKAEPENGGNYLPPEKHRGEGPSEADVGPVQRHFVRADEPDDVADTEVNDNASLLIKEKTDIDKRISVPLIHDVQNDGDYSGADNQALRFELEYLNWGAITAEQRQARRGHYFTITWDNDGPPGDFTTRFQYREVKSKEVVRSLEQTAHNVSGATRAYFAVTNKAYLTYGPVVSWRFTVLRGDIVVAEAKSFIW